MDLETMPRRGRRAVALAGLVLAAVVTVAGCNGGGKSSSDSAAGGAAASAAPSASTASDTASTTAPAASPPGRTPPTGWAATPAEPAPGRPSADATPPVNGIAPGEPNPAGTGVGTGARPPVGYRMDGSNRLTVYFFGGVCTKYALKADESQPGRVDVLVVVGPSVVQPGQACSALAKRQSVSADLRSPLAGRTVVDQSSGQDVPLEGDPHAGPDPVTPDVAGQ
ncbi:hypothetical protein [Streptomyces sp. FH025]|uniref:hypothetical protein n=1 Tax=Streptomyces sp. FH025 TaxID=2815937 RepID=UPI001A9F3AA5|nr:hypothetical protein [Streptomyces sp. FH025]MBO1413963.1 hypothetical protein [Streptomyces sp. FH025]